MMTIMYYLGITYYSRDNVSSGDDITLIIVIICYLGMISYHHDLVSFGE